MAATAAAASSASSPRASAASAKTLVVTRESGIEQFRFRNAAPPSPRARDIAIASTASTFTSSGGAAPPRAYSRLYAQGVDLLEHKDSVFRQFGLLKSPRERSNSSSTTSKATTTTAATTTSSSNTSPKAQSAPTLQRSTTSRKISVTRASQSSSSRTGQTAAGRRERGSSTPYLSDRCVLPAGAAVARTFSFRSTLESRKLVSPKAKPLTNRRTATATATPTTWIAPRQTGSYASINSSRHQQPCAKRSTGHSSSPAKRTAQAGTFPPAGSPSRMRGSGGGSATSTGAHRTAGGGHSSKSPARRCTNAANDSQQQRQVRTGDGGSHRRESFARPATSSTHAHAAAPASKRQSVRMGVPTTFAGGSPDASNGSAPVLIQVSRRTSSSIVTPSVAEFGMRRRPSVSPIPSIQAGDASVHAPQPRASVLLRRDSKMERLVEQISVLKASLGLSDEDLQWKVESTKGNAFLAAERHLSDGEERYDRLVYEVQMLSQTPCEEVAAALVKQVREIMTKASAIAESKPQLATCQSDVARLKKELLDARIAAEIQVARANTAGTSISGISGTSPPPNDDAARELLVQMDAAKARILHVQEQLKDDLSSLNDMVLALGSATDRLAKTCAEFRFLSPEVADVSSQLISILKRIPECGAGEKLISLCEQAIATAQKLRGSRLRDLKKKDAELAKTMTDIEVWKARRDQAKELPVELAKRELAWRAEHSADNAAALALMRSFVPQDVQQLSIEGIIERAAQRGVLFTFDLAMYVKQNRFLHWLVTHASDVARDNFLAVECASWFTNFVAYDVYELRALSAVLPPPNALTGGGSFDFDKDGRKAEWRTQFMDHVYALVKQQRGESVRAGWDPVRRMRGEVALKPLSDRQLLNTVYRYPSEPEIAARVAKFELQRQRLDQKRAKLEALERELIPAAKAEYLAIADDARSEELQRSFGKATLIAMRDDAKQALQSLTKSRDVLQSETAHSEHQWRALCPTYEQFLDEAAKIRALDATTRAARIRGPFPSELELQPRARAAFKKLSVEEEAMARKLELDHAIASRGKEMSDTATTESPESASQVPADSTSAAAAAAGTDEAAVLVMTGKRGGESVQTTGTPDSAATDGTVSDGLSATDVPDATATTAMPHGAFRRVKSLQVSAEVLRFLQKDFCSAQRVHQLAASHGAARGGHSTAKAAVTVAAAVRIKRFASEQSIDVRSSSNSGGTASSANANSVAAAPAAPVRPKSKALLKLFEKEQQQQTASSGATAGDSDASPRPPSMKMNMFSELQSRFAKKTSGNGSGTATSDDVSGASTPSTVEPAAPPKKAAMSFLDELKHRATRKLPSAEVAPLPSSALAAASECAPAVPAPASLHIVNRISSAAAPPAPTSFLAELRARARSVD